MTTTLNRHALAVVRQEAAARGWSRKRLCAEAQIRQVAMRGRKPLDIEEIFRAGEVVGVGGWDMLIQVSKGWRNLGPATADSKGEAGRLPCNTWATRLTRTARERSPCLT